MEEKNNNKKENKTIKIKDHIAKACGLKQVIFKDDVLYISQFAKGNDYQIIDKIYNDDRIESTPVDHLFEMESNERKLKLTKGLLYTDDNGLPINNPLSYYKNSFQKDDYLRMKSKLEKAIFNKTFNDNIHIQIAYCILDIRKILSLYVFNIIHSINPVFRI